MKTFIALLALVLSINVASAQWSNGNINQTTGSTHRIADKYIGAGDSAHYMGRLSMLVGGIPADSVSFRVSRRDSLDGHFVIAPAYWGKNLPVNLVTKVVSVPTDTVSVSAPGETIVATGDGAGAKVYTWTNMKAVLPLIYAYPALDVFFIVGSGSGMASDNQTFNVTPIIYPKDTD